MPHWFAAIIRSFCPAFSGLVWALRTQRNLRAHAVAAIIVTFSGLALGLRMWEWCAVMLAIGIVWVAELLNTAIEVLADRVSTEREEAIRRVKDVAAAAVLLAALTAVVIALLVFAPKIAALFEIVPPLP